MTTSNWLSAMLPMPPNMPPGIAWFRIAWNRDGGRRSGARSANCRSRQARVSSTRSPESSNVGSANSLWPPASALRRIPTASISSMNTMHCPPHLRASRFAFRAR